MDDFRLYTTALNSKDIATLFTYKRKGTISSTVSDQKMIGVWIAIAVVVVMIIIYLFRRKKKVE
jgi:preprotein translocase subunit SecF